MQLYLKRGSTYSITNEANIQLLNKLPIGVYSVGASMEGYFLQAEDNFKLPTKYYGDLPRTAQRIINTYSLRIEEGKSTGILLRGEKGGGKTLLAKKVAVDLNLPVILVGAAYTDDGFKRLIAGLGPSVVIFDEFEKVYKNKDDQNAILTLLDGVFPSQCLFFVTVNDQWALTDALRNRPTRLFYSLAYKGLSKEFITDYCADKLVNQKELNSVLTVTAFFASFNFDMLQCLIEEMNRYDENAHEAIKFLNIEADAFRTYETFSVKVTYDNKKVPTAPASQRIKEHPCLADRIYIYIAPTATQRKTYLSHIGSYFEITRENLTEVHQATDTYVFQKDKWRVEITKSEDIGWTMGNDPIRLPLPVGGDDD